MKEHCICVGITKDGINFYKIFGRELAESWKFKIVFTGSQEECLTKMKDYESN